MKAYPYDEWAKDEAEYDLESDLHFEAKKTKPRKDQKKVERETDDTIKEAEERVN